MYNRSIASGTLTTVAQVTFQMQDRYIKPGDPESGRVRTRAAVEELLDDVPRGLLSVEQAAVLLQWDIFRCDMPCYATGMQEGKRRRLDSECIEDEYPCHGG